MNFLIDLAMQLNHGKFEYNNRCGYLIKPEIMRRTDINKLFDPFSEYPFDGVVAYSLKMRVISGIFLNSSIKIESPCVVIELFGLPNDSMRGSKAYKVKPLSASYFNVNYAHNVFNIRKVTSPETKLYY